MFTQLCRLGCDAEIKYLPSGKTVAELALAYDVGFGDKKRTVWVTASLWGKQAESLTPFLTKGKQIVVTLKDFGPETWAKNDGSTGFKMTGNVVEIDLVSDKGNNSKPAAQQKQAPPPPPKREPVSSNAVADLDEDIPF